MRQIIALLFACSVFVACEKDDKETASEAFDGTYAGTFVRTGRDTVTIQLTFSDTSFSGSSSVNRYPAICHGSYHLSQGMVEFKDACPWTAEFDWTLILNGVYNLQASSDEIVFYRNSGAVKDEYRLKRISR